MIVSEELLNMVAAEKNILLYQGMSTFKQIENAVNIFRKNNCPLS